MDDRTTLFSNETVEWSALTGILLSNAGGQAKKKKKLPHRIPRLTIRPNICGEWV